MSKRYVIMIELGVDGQLRWLHAEDEEMRYNDAQAQSARDLHVAYKAIQRANIMQQEAKQESDGRLRALRMETAG